MLTTPTDDPLGNSDRTVGVHGSVTIASIALKREALLFDQIAIPPLHDSVPNVDGVSSLELDWLQDVGIVRIFSPFFNPDVVSDMAPKYMKHFYGMGSPDDPTEAFAELYTLMDRPGHFGLPELVSRVRSIYLRLNGIDAVPILKTRRQIGNVFPSGTTPVLEVVLKSMPIPDDQTAWEDIIEFRNDPESMKRLRRLRVWRM